VSRERFAVEPWCLRETALDLRRLAQSESVFALANGHIGLRGNLEEGEPHGIPGTYLNGVFETRPLPYPETAYGYPEAGQHLVSVTDGKIIRVLLDDEPLDVRYGRVVRHERRLDFRTGQLHREVEWVSPSGQGLRIRTSRLVSFVQRSVAAILVEVEPLGEPARVVLQSELVANEPVPVSEADADDPRNAAGLGEVLEPEFQAAHGERVVLVHRTRATALRVGAAMDHEISGPGEIRTHTETEEDLGRVTVTATIEPGERLRLVKYLAYGWSGQRSLPAVRDQTEAALAAARDAGWDALASSQREYLDDFWGRADVQIEGDAELQQAVRFAVFHTLQAGARAERRPVAAKGLTGPGYDGHAFWDAEAFVLPVLTYTVPTAAADALRWRCSTLDLARNRAAVLGLRGASFPWRTIDGRESSGYWPAGTAAFHVGAAIADAVIRYREVTGDDDFERDVGMELLIETARLWRSLGHHDAHGRFRIDGVTGPDEYSAIADNNVYTNLMAQRNLLGAAEAVERHPERARELGADFEEAAGWRDAARAMLIPYDAGLGVHPQSEGFTEHEVFDFASLTEDDYPLLLSVPYFDLYRKQVVKQADLVLALYRRGDAFTPEEKLRDFEYYEGLTVRDSSLSACVQAIVAAEVGHVELAYDYFGEAALIDLADLHHNARNGVHIASLAGAWLVAVAGFGGLRDDGGRLVFAPRLPQRIQRLAFRVAFRSRMLAVEIRHTGARYTLLEGEPLDIVHHGDPFRLIAGIPQSRPLPRVPDRPVPRQPAGRAPVRRTPAG
jgi:alpha,alpha-trehalose phosphorylase